MQPHGKLFLNEQFGEFTQEIIKNSIEDKK